MTGARVLSERKTIAGYSPSKVPPLQFYCDGPWLLPLVVDHVERTSTRFGFAKSIVHFSKCMTVTIDHKEPSKGPRQSRLTTVAVVLLVVVGLAVLLSPFLLGLVGTVYMAVGTSSSVPRGECGGSVAVSLIHAGLFGTIPGEPEYSNLRSSIARQVKGVNGFTHSAGIHGDGTDWYEVEFAPELAVQLRSKVQWSATARETKYFPGGRPAPSWWPSTWPADARCFQIGSDYLVLPDSGTRAWYVRNRI